MPLCTYLDQVGSTYYFRRVVPAELRPFIRTKTGAPRAEWKLTLRTKDRETAKRLLPGFTVSTQAEIDAAVAMRAEELAQPLLKSPTESAQRMSGRMAAMESAAFEHGLEGAEIAWQLGAEKEARRAEAALVTFFEERLKGSTRDMPPEYRAIKYMIEGVEWDRTLSKEQLSIAKGEIRRLDTEIADLKGQGIAPIGEATTHATDIGTMLDTNIIPLWAAERKPVQKGRDTHASVATWFYDRVGRIPVDKIVRKDVLAFKDALIAEGQTAANTNMKLSRLSTLLQWAADNDHAADNPAKAVSVKDTDKAKNRRLPFELSHSLWCRGRGLCRQGRFRYVSDLVEAEAD